MKRVDFDPDGERNPQNRGTSGYERISWDEALDMVAAEIKRVKRDHGPGAIMNGSGSHHTWGVLGYWLSARIRFFNMIGWTPVVHNPDSWEGWYWGAAHHWGQSARNGGGETYGTVEDLLQARRDGRVLVLATRRPRAASTAPTTAPSAASGSRTWASRCVHIDPFHNHTAQLLGGKWIAPRPGTDSAMVLAIAHVWMTEGLYDEEYVAERTVGFEKWQAYVLGEEDGVPKTPEWQEAETGVPARDLRALARAWGKKKTYLAAGGLIGFGGACRTATGSDWARGVVCLMAMQGLGKPGVNMGCLQQGTPLDTHFFFPGYAEGGYSGDLDGTALSINMYQRMPQLPTVNTITQAVPRLKIPEAILDGHCEGYPDRLQVDRGPVPALRVSGAGPQRGQDVLQVRRLALRHHDRHQPLRAHVPLATSSSSSSTRASGWRARRSSPTSSCRPAPTSSAGTSASSPTAAATSSTPSRSATTASR